jgi:hypothetical protein
MQKVCDVLEQLLNAGVVGKYAIGGATACLISWRINHTPNLKIGIPPGNFTIP